MIEDRPTMRNKRVSNNNDYDVSEDFVQSPQMNEYERRKRMIQPTEQSAMNLEELLPMPKKGLNRDHSNLETSNMVLTGAESKGKLFAKNYFENELNHDTQNDYHLRMSNLPTGRMEE